MVANFVRVLRSDVRQYISAERRNCTTDPTVHSSTRDLSFDGQMIAAGVETDCRNSVKIARPTVVSAMHFTFTLWSFQSTPRAYYATLPRGRIKRFTTSVCPSVYHVPPIFSKWEAVETFLILCKTALDKSN